MEMLSFRTKYNRPGGEQKEKNKTGWYTLDCTPLSGEEADAAMKAVLPAVIKAGRQLLPREKFRARLEAGQVGRVTLFFRVKKGCRERKKPAFTMFLMMAELALRRHLDGVPVS